MHGGRVEWHSVSEPRWRLVLAAGIVLVACALILGGALLHSDPAACKSVPGETRCQTDVP